MGKISLVSIIVPVYNAAEYLERILISLEKQTYKHIEIILVDDGSKDGSGEICDKYAKLHERIKVIHTDNGGAAKARNLGIKIAQGKYIGFVDSDDDIVLDYVESLIGALEKYHLDIVVCGYKKVFERELNEHISYMGNIEKIEMMTGEEALELMMYRKTLTSSPWCKILKSELVKKEEFPDGKLFEDLGTVYKWYIMANRVGYTSKVGYFYWQRDGSCQHSTYNPQKWDLIFISKEILKYVEKYNPKVLPAANNRLFISAVQILRYIPFGEYPVQVRELKVIIKRYRNEIIKNKKSKQSSRILGLIAFINIDLLRILGKIYDKIGQHLKLVLKY